MNLIYPAPPTIVNNTWLLKNEYLQQTVATLSDEIPFTNFNDTYSNLFFDHELYQQSFLQVITETVFNYPTTFITEKTMKPIANKRPFVIVGPVGSLTRLHELGFKTFRDFWDESYDQIADPDERILAVVDIIESICNRSISELQDLCIKMGNVLHYNFAYYINDFKNNELVKFEQACIENLKPR